MDYQNIIYETEDRIARIILNRPEKMNALSFATRLEIVDALKRAERDESVRVVIVKGAGRTFSAGYDLQDAGRADPNSPPSLYISKRLDRVSGQDHFVKLDHWMTSWNLLKPVIAQIHGYCLAGATEMTSLMDMRIVAEDAQIGYPPMRNLNFGNVLMPPWLMGISKAKEYCFTGDSMDGKEAYRVGWATRVYPADKLEEETEKLAQRIALVETDLIMMTKRAINRTYEIMGLKVAMDVTNDVAVLASYRESAGEFQRAIREKGLKAALEERDAPFKDYRTAVKR
ncbi:MAG: enoyl-CoA hydratase/isomerase family protein [Chloroflexi bacterium]|nr:enoyl-CoA hydratase/isomerase family protein [Chloroflexota bacterium]